MPALPRPHLLARLDAPGPPLVLLEAPAGAGKSWLLAALSARSGAPVHRVARLGARARSAGGWLLWDPAPDGTAQLDPDLAEALLAGGLRLALARRPGRAVRGLARLRLYGGEARIGAADFALRDDEPGAAALAEAGLGDWPCFLRYATGDDALLTDFLDEALLAPLPPATLVALSLWRARGGAVPAAAEALLPPGFLARPEGQPRLSATLARALELAIARAVAAGEAAQVAEALTQGGDPLGAMQLLLAQGDEPGAAHVLEQARGRELIYRSDPRAFQAIILGFSQEAIAGSETVLLAIARSLLKQGEMLRARHLLARHMGSDYLDPLKVLARGARYSFAARSFRLNLMIVEDLTPTDTMITRLYEFMSDYPVGDDAKWAAFYNALLEFEIRRRNFPAAEAAAARALLYLRRGEPRPLLCFFIHLHQGVLRLAAGDAVMARQAAAEARAALEQVAHEAVAEYRMLRLLEAALAWEAGKPQALVRFLDTEFEAFAAGEIWPSLMQFALHYAAEAMAGHYPMLLRRGCLDSLWIHLAHTLQFRTMMEIRMARLLQGANRWSEAVEILQALRLAQGRAWIEAATEELTRLSDRDAIAHVMTWLRHDVHAERPRAYLERQLAAMIANPAVTPRERLALQLWTAYLHRQRRDTGAARAQLISALEAIHRQGCLGVLIEERLFVAELVNDRRIRPVLETSAEIRAVLAAFAGAITSPTARAVKAGLTQREAQLLRLLAQGQSNKRIAQSLDLAEVTVKFHLGNLYRKTGCRNRREALAAATALGWL